MDNIVNNDACWAEFEKTGSVADYLKYKCISNENIKQNTDIISFSSRESEPIGNL